MRDPREELQWRSTCAKRDAKTPSAAGAAQVALRGGRITAYSTGIAFFSHAVGERNEDVQALIAAAPAFHGSGFLVPTRNAALLRCCLEQGLRIVQPMTLMSMGRYEEPRDAWLASIS
jgi:hypothetical protein